MNKKIAAIFLLVCSSLIFSGCSFLPSSEQKGNSSNPVSEIFSKKAEKGSLWRTNDGGQTFQVKSQIDENSRISSADILSITYHPKKSGTIYVSTINNGIFKTENSGDNWGQIAFPPKRIHSFLLDKNDPDNRMLASGVLNKWAKIFVTSDGGKDWREAYTEPGQETVITALSQHSRDTNAIFAGTSSGTIVRSVDGGNTWKNIGNKVDGAVADISFDASKDQVTYLLIAEKKFYYSPDSGAAWLDWEEEKKKEIIALQEKASKASSNGDREKAKNIRAQAQELNERNKKNKMPAGIVSIAADPSVSGIIYAGTKKGLFRSVDYGKYWEEINIIESAKKFPIRSIAINPKNSKEIVFVAGKAFYKSVDNGETWATTGLNVDRDASFVSYDPLDSGYLFIGLRKF